MTARAPRLKGSHLNVAGHDPVHGGATLVSWLLGNGAHVTVTDARNGEATTMLARRVDEHLKRSAPDGRTYRDMCERLSWTARHRTDVVDALELFTASWPKRIVCVTGMHGKTTAAVWAGHLIGDAVVAGHMPERSYLSALGNRARTAVLEVGPQTSATGRRVSLVSTDDAHRYIAEEACLSRIDPDAFAAQWGSHNIANMATAVHAARLAGTPVAAIIRRIGTLPHVPYRQEVVYRDAKLTVVNDSAATTPEAGIAALRRWGGPTTVLITGGAGDAAVYRGWAEELMQRIRETNIVLVSGSASRMMRTALRRGGYAAPAFETLAAAWSAALERAATYVTATILLSPAVSSPVPFLSEYDRGQRFNALVNASGARTR